ncbi:Linear gramicidin synthase subunit B [Serratia marcescens]|uniref:Linear gramicidin synthase subunit B n=1 Tax=Serratia marcescens TaxID=615 RepID=A0A380AI76_SERMA|nr:Linear gramicidin synthase subunit B [Serratia marcescens]
MWYLTGDDGIQDARYGLLFRGRRDAQWQVRGYRVERGEIEGLMRKVAETPHVAVLPVTGENALVISMAVFVEGSPFSVKEMRQRCHQFLPDYLFPGQIIEMSLPRNRNMKTDYLALHHHLAQASCGAKNTGGT